MANNKPQNPATENPIPTHTAKTIVPDIVTFRNFADSKPSRKNLVTTLVPLFERVC